jgi:hypothetical protein
VDPLASVADLQARMARDLTPREASVRAPALLRDASSRVRSYTGQTISREVSTDVLVPVTFGRLELPQGPVVTVSSVADTEGNDLAVLWPMSTDLRLVGLTGLVTYQYVKVTYTHGWDPVPDDLVAVVCQIAGRALGVPMEQSGITQESIDAYSYGVGSAAASGGLGLLDGERQVLDGYRPLIGTAWHP